MHILFWLPLVAASLHVFEEFAWPGGFAAWYRAYRPEIESSISTRFLLGINALLLGTCLAIGVSGPTRSGSALFLMMTALFFTNGLFHLRATLRMRSYSPGVVTGVLLYAPLAVFGSIAILQHGFASLATAITNAIAGGAYPLLSIAVHRRRAAKRPRAVPAG